MTSGDTGNSVIMNAEETPYSLWELEATDGGFYVHNVNAAYNGNANQYLEYYSGFTTYGLGAGGDKFLFNVYVLPTDCAHEATEIVNAEEASCGKTGYTGDTVCADCGKVLEEGSVISALGHDYSKTEVVEPTCEELGYTKNICVYCDSYYRNNFVDALGHDYKDGVCAICGEQEEVSQPDAPDVPENPTILDQYEDLRNGAWYAPGVTYMLENGLMIGVDDGIFAPDGELTRAMFVTILYRAAGEPDVSYVKNPYYDVQDDTWYTDAILWATSYGIVNGVDYGYFAPDKAITREQIVTILWRYNNSPESAQSLAAFADDKTVSAYAQEAMAWAVEEGIINGNGGRLNPTDHATRAEAAVIFYRYLIG